MSTEKKIARLAGALFIIGTAAGLLSIAPAVDAPDYLTGIAENSRKVLAAAFFQFVMAAAYLGFAMSLYPILRKHNEGIAFGFVGFRFMAGVFNVVGVIGILLLLTLSQDYIKSGISDSSYYQLVGGLLRAGRDFVNHVAMVLAQSVGGMLYYYIFYQAKLVPRWLSGWGMVGAAMAIAASFFVMFRFIEIITPIYIALNLPVAVQEMTLAIWLLVRGFSPVAVASKPA